MTGPIRKNWKSAFLLGGVLLGGVALALAASWKRDPPQAPAATPAAVEPASVEPSVVKPRLTKGATCEHALANYSAASMAGDVENLFSSKDDTMSIDYEITFDIGMNTATFECQNDGILSSIQITSQKPPSESDPEGRRMVAEQIDGATRALLAAVAGGNSKFSRELSVAVNDIDRGQFNTETSATDGASVADIVSEFCAANGLELSIYATLKCYAIVTAGSVLHLRFDGIRRKVCEISWQFASSFHCAQVGRTTSSNSICGFHYSVTFRDIGP